MEFPGWTNHDSVKAYISLIQECLHDDQSQQNLRERLPHEAVDMLVEKLVGRFRPISVAIVCLFMSTDMKQQAKGQPDTHTILF
jgi:hypothetical protein